MLQHYFKIAFRNLLKYKSQTIISIIGLSVGFVCFSLSMVWMQHEQNFDTFHPKGDRIYLLYGKYNKGNISYSISSKEIINDLESKYPEIEDVALIKTYLEIVETTTPSKKLYIREVNKSFFNVFDVGIKSLKEGIDPPAIAITDEASKILFTDQNPIDKEVTKANDESFRITEVIKAWPKNSRIEFDMLRLLSGEYKVDNTSIYVLVKEGTDVGLLNSKLGSYEGSEGKFDLELIPISKTRQYDSNNSNIIVKYDNLKTFALLGLLIIMCAFLNYLILFINRISIRKSELALRKVNGASNNSFILLFGSEFILLLLAVLFTSTIFLQLVLPDFKTMSEVIYSDASILLYSVIYSILLAILIFSISILPLQYYKARTIRQVINKKSGGMKSQSIFYRASILIQLVIGIGFLFCTVVFIKQVQFIQRKTIGYDYTNVSKIGYNVWKYDATPLFDKIKNLPDVSDAILTNNDIFYLYQSSTIRQWEGKGSDESESIPVSLIYVTAEYFNFYKMEFIAGEKPNSARSIDETVYYINRTAAKEFGWTPESAIGKKIEERSVAGVFEDCILNPKEKAEPLLAGIIPATTLRNPFIQYRYTEGKRKETEEAITKIVNEVYPSEEVSFLNLEELRKSFFLREETFLKILKIASLTCVIIALFGVYSMISLACTRRRKEIAIRKVNGASVRSILYNILREQLIMVFIAAAIALPIGYKIMKVWIEGYLKQTEISWWLFPPIVIVIILLITLTVSGLVWRTANQNPAEVLKSE